MRQDYVTLWKCFQVSLIKSLKILVDLGTCLLRESKMFSRNYMCPCKHPCDQDLYTTTYSSSRLTNHAFAVFFLSYVMSIFYNFRHVVKAKIVWSVLILIPQCFWKFIMNRCLMKF